MYAARGYAVVGGAADLERGLCCLPVCEHGTNVVYLSAGNRQTVPHLRHDARHLRSGTRALAGGNALSPACCPVLACCRGVGLDAVGNADVGALQDVALGKPVGFHRCVGVGSLDTAKRMGIVGLSTSDGGGSSRWQ